MAVTVMSDAAGCTPWLGLSCLTLRDVLRGWACHVCRCGMYSVAASVMSDAAGCTPWLGLSCLTLLDVLRGWVCHV